jgi:MoaA/NifB/PqqE/SkfB family radical SAM enzyme
MIKIDQIRALHIELSSRCNARCPMCMRNYRGVDFNGGYPLTELSLSDIQHIFPSDFLKQINRINFNGNLGDFSLASDALEIVEYFLSNSTAKIQIETNGSTRSTAWWQKLNNHRIEVLFALDGLKDTHSLYRQDTDWEKIIDNAVALIQAGGNAVWKFIPFKHNQHQFDSCQTLSRQLGFSDFIVRDHGRNQGPVFTRNGEFSHWLGDAQPDIPDANNLIEDHVTWFDHKKKIPWVDDNAQIDCGHIKQKEIYIAADGSVYPCCYLGFFPKTMHQPGNSQFKDLVKENNALEYSLEHCIDWFEQVEKTWTLPSVAQGKLYMCVSACGH